MPKDVDENLKPKIEFIMKSNESLAEIIIKTRLNNYCSNIRMETIFLNTENSKSNEPHKFVLNLWQILGLRSSDKHINHQNLSIYYTWNNIRKQYKNKKLKIIAPTWNDEFELPDGSYSFSDILDYIEYVIKNHETLAIIPPIYVYINRINNRSVFKIKDG